MTKFEKLVKDIMLEMEKDGEPITQEEAEEMAKMELGAKEIKRYEHSEETEKKEHKPRERKVDEEKGHILKNIKVLIEGMQAENVSMKTETELSFLFNGNSYTLKLTKHRPKK